MACDLFSGCKRRAQSPQRVHFHLAILKDSVRKSTEYCNTPAFPSFPVGFCLPHLAILNVDFDEDLPFAPLDAQQLDFLLAFQTQLECTSCDRCGQGMSME